MWRKPVSVVALGMLLAGGCCLVQSRRYQEQADAVPSMTCDQLVRNGPGGNRYIKLTDVALGGRGDVAFRDMDAALTTYVPIYSARLQQEPPPRDLALVLEILDDRNRQRVLGSPAVGTLTCELWSNVDQLDLWAQQGLESKYPGIQLPRCRVVSVGLHEPTAFKVRQYWWQGIAMLAAGTVILGCIC